MDPLDLLREGEVTIEGRMPYSSNATFLVDVTLDDATTKAIYKPLRGERPLWDFEPGLHRREVSAYELSVAMGIDLVPPTVLRDGPLGEGSVQWYVEADHRQHYFTIHEAREDLHPVFLEVAVFDIIANNTDRKSGHLLIDDDDHIWGIDHGLCFAADFKLRTVVWEFGGEQVPDHLVEAARRISLTPPSTVAALLSTEEVDAMQERAAWIVEHPVLPVDTSGRRYPWPLV